MTTREKLEAAIAARKLPHADLRREAFFREIRNRHRTTLIGALSRFEEFFGFLWGHGKRAEDRTDAERDWHAVWDECRTRILDHGHAQLRALENQLSKSPTG